MLHWTVLCYTSKDAPTFIHHTYHVVNHHHIHIQVHYFTEESSYAHMFFTIHHRGQAYLYVLYIIHQTTHSILILCKTYNQQPLLILKEVRLVDEVFNDSDQMMVRSAAKHITFIASNLKLLLRHQKYCDPESTQSTVQVCEQQRNFVSSLTCVFFAGD